jgi:uncharacterized protein (TIGR02145 family)
MKTKSLVFTIAILVNASSLFGQETGTYSDSRNGKTYNTVKVGKQNWISENLNVTTFKNGDTIPEAKTWKEWTSLSKREKPVWCYQSYNSTNGIKYGKLYNWYAVNDPRGLAPEGWHIPNVSEWETMATFLGENAGTKMKSTSGWEKTYEVPSEYGLMPGILANANNLGKWVDGHGNNQSGFDGLPGGQCIDSGYGGYDPSGTRGAWWSSSEPSHLSKRKNEKLAWVFYLSNGSKDLGKNFFSKQEGKSVRCIRDL